MHARRRRGTIHLEDGEVLSLTSFPGAQRVLRLRAPATAASARPGSFAHVTCDEAVPMRRPLSIMRVNAEAGWVEFLFKIVGHGLTQLGRRKPGDTLSILGPIGRPFRPDPTRPLALLIGGGVGIPPMVFLAEAMQDAPDDTWQPLVLMGSEIPFPFAARASGIEVARLPAAVRHAMPLLDDLGIASRLASGAGFSGCFLGFVTELANLWLAQLDKTDLAQVQIYACGPTPMLRAAADLARKYDVPAQVSLEEYMACAVGGCAGCTVPVYTGRGGLAMQRVCVDGPVFDARSVFFDPDLVAIKPN